MSDDRQTDRQNRDIDGGCTVSATTTTTKTDEDKVDVKFTFCSDMISTFPLLSSVV